MTFSPVDSHADYDVDTAGHEGVDEGHHQMCLSLSLVVGNWGALLTQDKCVLTAFCKIFSGTPHLTIFGAPKYAPKMHIWS